MPWTSDPSLVDRAAWTGNLRRASWVWALAPLATCGLGNVPVFLYAAIRQRRRSWWYAFGGYVAATVSMFSLTNAIEDSAADNVQTILIMTNWVVGAGHALATRQRVFQPPATLDLGNDPVLAAAVHAQGRRDLARNILAQNPGWPVISASAGPTSDGGTTTAGWSTRTLHRPRYWLGSRRSDRRSPHKW